MTQQPAIDYGGSVVTPASVWYVLLFSSSAQTDTGSMTLPSCRQLEIYDDPESGNCCHYCYDCNYLYHLFYCCCWIYCNNSGWLESVGSRIAYELDHKNPVLYVIPIQSILRTAQETTSCTRRRHRDNSTQSVQRLSWRARRPQAGCL
jgi:hypothetical protein